MNQYAPDVHVQFRAMATALSEAEEWVALAEHGLHWLAQYPESEEAHVAYLVGLSRSDQHDKVVEHIEYNWPDAFRDAIANTLAVTAYNAVHRYQDAIAAATRVLGLESCLDIVWREQAWALLQCGQYDAAAASAKRYLQSNPHDAVALYMQAHALTEAGRYAEALPVAEQWLQCDPIPAAWSRKIQALLGLQRYEEAAAAAETLSLMAPEDPRAASLAAVALAGANDPRALEAARKWVRLDPANGAAKRLLDQLSEHEA